MDRSRGASVEDAGQEESERGQYRKIAWPPRRVSENKSTRIASDPLQEGEGDGEPANIKLSTPLTSGFRAPSIAFAFRLRLGGCGRGTSKMRILGIVALGAALGGCAGDTI